MLPEMLYGAAVRSQIPRGTIKKITFGPGIALTNSSSSLPKISLGKYHRADS
jgi:hypothetical protein